MIRARFIGMEDISNRPIPLFYIPRDAFSSARAGQVVKSPAACPPIHAESSR